MIDLTKNQIVDPPIEVWVKAIGSAYNPQNVKTQGKAMLIAIDHRLSAPYLTIRKNTFEGVFFEEIISLKEDKNWIHNTATNEDATFFGMAHIRRNGNVNQ